MPSQVELGSLNSEAERHLVLDSGGRRVIIVGDVHGCFDELLELEKRVFHADDYIILAGDLVPAPHAHAPVPAWSGCWSRPSVSESTP
jgi:hypothetical protein